MKFEVAGANATPLEKLAILKPHLSITKASVCPGKPRTAALSASILRSAEHQRRNSRPEYQSPLHDACSSDS